MPFCHILRYEAAHMLPFWNFYGAATIPPGVGLAVVARLDG
jgi:hypothetical protein